MATITRYAQTVIIALLRCYQFLFRPILGDRCRFYPSCSDYAITAVARHGCGKGGYFTLRRLLRCHPLHPGGFDYVPPKPSEHHGK